MSKVDVSVLCGYNDEPCEMCHHETWNVRVGMTKLCNDCVAKSIEFMLNLQPSITDAQYTLRQLQFGLDHPGHERDCLQRAKDGCERVLEALCRK